MRIISIQRKLANQFKAAFPGAKIVESNDSKDLVNIEISEVLRIGISYDHAAFIAFFYDLDNPENKLAIRREYFWMIEIM